MTTPKTANYGAMFKKLNKKIIESTHPLIDKKPKKYQHIYYPTNSQLHLLDICGYKGYNMPLLHIFDGSKPNCK
jgi:hypothetical protein